MARVFRILIMKPALTNGEVMITLKLSKKAGYMKSTLNSDDAIDFRTVYSKKVNYRIKLKDNLEKSADEN